MSVRHQWDTSSRLLDRGYETWPAEGYPYARTVVDSVEGVTMGIVDPLAAMCWLEGAPASDVEGNLLPPIRVTR